MPEGQSHELDGMATVVLRLTRKSENTSHKLLEHPIRPDRFQQWLQSVERDLRRTAAPTGSASGAHFRLLRRARRGPCRSGAGRDAGRRRNHPSTLYQSIDTNGHGRHACTMLSVQERYS